MVASFLHPPRMTRFSVLAVLAVMLVSSFPAFAQNALRKKQKSSRKYSSLIIQEVPARDKSKRAFIALYAQEAKEATSVKYQGGGFGLLLVGDRKALGTQVVGVNTQLAKAGKGLNTAAVKSRIDNAVSSLVGQFRVRPLDESELKAVIGGPSFRGSKASLAMNKDVDMANSALAGVAGAASGAGAIGSYVATVGGITPAVAGASANLTGIVMGGAGGTFLGAGLGAVVGAGGLALAGGIAIGTGGDKLAGAFISWATNGEENSIGGWLASKTEDSDPPASNTSDNSGDQSGNPDAGTSRADNSSGDDGSSTEDDSSGDDGSTSGGEGGDSGTANPMNDENSDPSRVLTFAIATGLGKSEATRVLKALDTKGGGALGASRSTITMQQILAFDAAVGGMYLRSINRSLAARRGARGFRESTRVGGDLKMIYDGVTDPANISAKVNTARFRTSVR